ncbi:MAG: hypothetical protein Q8R76_09340 [Candidatus Omnitrophota bacterium]|nr:hypothetical protein [Candidatus Omnitrophota bacterium]
MQWRIGEILVREKLINWVQLEEALDEQSHTRELTGMILVRKGFISWGLLYRSLARQNRMRFVDLERTHINPEALAKVPATMARKLGILPVEIRDDVLTIAVPGPFHVWADNELKETAGIAKVCAVLALPRDIERAIKLHYPTGQPEKIVSR